MTARPPPDGCARQGGSRGSELSPDSKPGDDRRDSGESRLGSSTNSVGCLEAEAFKADPASQFFSGDPQVASCFCGIPFALEDGATLPGSQVSVWLPGVTSAYLRVTGNPQAGRVGKIRRVDFVAKRRPAEPCFEIEIATANDSRGSGFGTAGIGFRTAGVL